MKVTEYIRRKNELIKKNVGFDLIPTDQIFDVPAQKLFMDADKYACPYCVNFSSNQCVSCPMYLAGNDCHLESSTYARMCDCIGDLDMTHYEAPWYSELCDLVAEFNKQFKT